MSIFTETAEREKQAAQSSFGQLIGEGRKYCMRIDEACVESKTDDGRVVIRPILVVADEPAKFTCDYTWTVDSVGEARELAHEYNTKLGLTLGEVQEIVTSSFRAMSRR